MVKMIVDKWMKVWHHLPLNDTCVSFRYLDYGDAEWKQQANEALKSLETWVRDLSHCIPHWLYNL